nr:receptor-type tyrosine-protein phosphatase f [Quercus suber]
MTGAVSVERDRKPGRERYTEAPYAGQEEFCGRVMSNECDRSLPQIDSAEFPRHASCTGPAGGRGRVDPACQGLELAHHSSTQRYEMVSPIWITVAIRRDDTATTYRPNVSSMAFPTTLSASSPSYHPMPSSSSSSRPSLPAKTPSASAVGMPSYFGARLASPRPPAHAQRTPSPNYFQYQASDSNCNSDSVQHHAKGNWSPPSSTVRSTAAASPSVLPVDQNPEFSAFKKQSEGKAFNLGGLNTGFSSESAVHSNQHKHARTSSKTLSPVKEPLKGMDMNLSSRPRKASIATANLDPSTAELSRSPKRVLSPGSLMHSEIARKVSPATLYNSEGARPSSQPRFDLPLDTPSTVPSLPKIPRAETLPTSSDATDAQLFATPQHIVNLLESKPEDVLILDLRVSAHYALSHITGALSLCIPTTLLKRPSFNVQKLAETFKDEAHRKKFEKWRRCTHIIVYDAASAQLKDAQICINTMKKFRSEGFEDAIYIIKGGFKEFSKSFSAYIDHPGERPNQDNELSGPNVAPVVGGCLMPGTDKPANPFFGNIRQNMDLIGGVGQIALTHPKKSTKHKDVSYPKWLSGASAEVDQGKEVSDKFLAIERREKKRMEDALSDHVSWSNSPSQRPSPRNIRIAGIEKGTKNRYNNIWPFEHSRVKLQGVPKNDCDYFNANFVQASLSNKRYISTQAPIPATFIDFWSVVWQQDVRVIVMLTAEQEGAQVKAHNYWGDKKYGPYLLEFLSEKRASLEPARIHRAQKQRPAANKRMSTNSTHPQIPLAPITSASSEDKDQPYVIVRKSTLSHQNRPFEPMREITQLQYSSWPDFGAPAHPAHVLGLVEQTDACVRASNKTSSSTSGSKSDRPSLGTRTFSSEPEPVNTRPVLVHCSAGCGRTGTFCTIDSVIDMLKRQRTFKDRSNRHRVSADMKMDVDETTPAGDLAVQKSDPFRTTANKQEGANDFFTSQAFQDDAGGINGRWIRKDDLDLIERTVEDFRLQRLSMVQSLRQFVLCYESVMEWLAEQERSPDSA